MRPFASMCCGPSGPWLANRSSGGWRGSAKRSAAPPRSWSRSSRCGVRPCLRLGSRAMGQLSSTEQQAVERAAAEPMLEQVEAWAAVNSGSRNLAGLGDVAYLLSDAFAPLPGELAFEEPQPVDAVDSAGRTMAIEHGKNLHVTVRPDAPVQLLFTGHMDTVFGVDHPFQSLAWLEPGKVLGGPGVADMKGGIAVMLAALKAVEANSGRGAFGYEVVINSDEE